MARVGFCRITPSTQAIENGYTSQLGAYKQNINGELVIGGSRNDKGQILSRTTPEDYKREKLNIDKLFNQCSQSEFKEN